MMLPMLDPAIAAMGMRCCSKTFRTPRCAKPRAKPPPSARDTPLAREGLAGHSGTRRVMRPRLPEAAECNNEPSEPEHQYGRTGVETRAEFLPKCKTVPSS